MVGDTAEDFTLKDQNGKDFNLYNNLNLKILLIFYPKDDTPVCTKQLSDYQMNKNEFLQLGILLVGINADSANSHLNFAEKCNLDFLILSDPEKSVCKKYKAVNFLGGIKRKLVLIDKTRKILFEDEVISFKYRSTDHLKSLFQKL